MELELELEVTWYDYDTVCTRELFCVCLVIHKLFILLLFFRCVFFMVTSRLRSQLFLVGRYSFSRIHCFTFAFSAFQITNLEKFGIKFIASP